MVDKLEACLEKFDAQLVEWDAQLTIFRAEADRGQAALKAILSAKEHSITRLKEDSSANWIRESGIFGTRKT